MGGDPLNILTEDPTMPDLQRREIADGGVLLFDPHFLAPDEADALFARLRAGTPWGQETASFGKPFPRLTAYYADPGVSYTYSGVTHPALPWPEDLVGVRARVEAATGGPLNSVLLNYYRDGSDSIGYHADAEHGLGPNPVVPWLSLGAARLFHLRHARTGERISYALGGGSLLVMAGTTQHHWRHAVPKTRKPVGPRINLTFRCLLPGGPGAARGGG
jgi:alkylated DNA repair dioxygenase AlkB